MMLRFFLVFSLFTILLTGCKNDAEKNSVKLTDQKNDLFLPIEDTTKSNIDMTLFTEEKAKEALEFSTSNKMNEDFCILIDMGIHSGKKRFFVWDFKKNLISHRFLVGHGCGENSWSSDETRENPTFSNIEDSHRSSLGKYKIGERGSSEWGVHTKYLMHGLEDSNNNALRRFIVFHSWEAVSDIEVYPAGTPEGWGCPTISNASFELIDPMLKHSEKPVLMWIYSSKSQ